ncbi:hypothetical protein HNR42_002481 [Deinobacterium chartae]|uniref:Uncharacterized protein n=1 Tax=Deinobacterium chartae TaxID=521158 RepID=A0A841I591_9DEIO|nr:hypothetical protein [Deinobacterium chartae]MBB6099045.1 hypothetical protein [Deinobacterium chartae]
MTTRLTQDFTSQPPVRIRASLPDNLITLALSGWLMVGIFVDGWAHNTFATRLETFFTPWHAIFYSGFLATALWMLWLTVRGLRAGQRGWYAVPQGYELGIIGIPVFALGGMGDMIWHTVLGIEVGIEALLSPTHLLLFLGAEMLACAPFLAAWREPVGRRAPLGTAWTAVLSLTVALCFASFMHMYMWAVSIPPQGMGYEATSRGLTAVLLTSAILFAPSLLLLRRFRPPAGAFTVMFTVNAALMVVLTTRLGELAPVLLGLVTGLCADALAWRLRPEPLRPLAFRLFAALTPLAMWTLFFLGLARMGELSLSLELWAGVSVMTALGGLGLSCLALPPALPLEAQTASSTD